VCGAVSRNFSVILLALARTLNQIEGNTNRFVSMLGVAIWKPEDGNDALAVGSLYITARFQKTVGHVTNELFCGFGKDSGL
jgi:hypothetical protein